MVLQALVRRRGLVVVHFHRTRYSYQSMLLALRAELGEMVLDELFPSDGVDELQRGDLASVVCHDSGLPLSFVTRLLGREDLDGYPAYRMELPGSIDGDNPRQAYRVYVENEQDLSLSLMFDDTAETVRCRIVNLSVDGLKIDLDGDRSTALRHQGQFDGCQLHLPGGDQVGCAITVRNTACVRTPTLRTLAGASLKIPSAPGRVKLNRYLAAVQRQQRRREMRF